jgi:hypothetical protein
MQSPQAAEATNAARTEWRAAKPPEAAPEAASMWQH